MTILKKSSKSPRSPVKRRPPSLAELQRIEQLHRQVADLTASKIDEIREIRQNNQPPPGSVVKFVKWPSEKKPNGYLYAAICIGEDQWVPTIQTGRKELEKGYFTWTELLKLISYDQAWVVKDESAWEPL